MTAETKPSSTNPLEQFVLLAKSVKGAGMAHVFIGLLL